MNIVVCVKYVPDAQADRRFDETTLTTDRVNVEGLLSELDEYAVEEALKLVEANEGEVTVVTIGPERAADALKKALQMGADKAVHICDDAILGTDSLGTSLLLAAAVNKIGTPDLVLTGMASTDGTMSVVPAMLAERLGLPQVTFASELTIAGTTVTMRRDGDAASETVVATMRPWSRSPTRSTNRATPRSRGSWRPRRSRSRRGRWPTSATKRPPREQGQIVTDEGDGGTKLAEFLSARKFI